MIIKKLGLMMLLMVSAGMAQQRPLEPQPSAAQQPQAKPPLPAAAEETSRRAEEAFKRAEETRRRAVEARQHVVANLQNRMRARSPQQAMAARPPLERALGMPGGKWWANPEVAQRLGLTADQTKKMDDIFQQHRLKLIDFNASLQKEELIMEPLIGAEQPDEGKIVAQIDKVALARAELEKANARMLLGIRRLLTPEQWNKLKADAQRQPQMILQPQPARR